MINIYVVLGILFFHWVFDFVFQTHKQSINKSTSFSYLLEHTFTYSICWLPLSFIFGVSTDASAMLLLFAPITFVAHTATDYYTSKVNSQLWKEGDVHNFFVSIGFDQFLHFTQLLLTFYFLTK